MSAAAWSIFVAQELQPLLDAGRAQDGFLALHHFIEKNPQHVDALMTMGNWLTSVTTTEAVEGAFVCYERAMRARRNYAPAYQAWAAHAWQHGRARDAINALKSAIFFAPREEAAWKLYDQMRVAHEQSPHPAPDIIFYLGHPLGQTLVRPSQLGAQALGGSESVLLTMASALRDAGRRVAIYGNFSPPGDDAGIACCDMRDYFFREPNASHPISIVSREYWPFIYPVPSRRRMYWLHDIVVASFRDQYQLMDPHVDEYWTLSQYQRGLYVERCGLRPEKFWQTTNAVDVAAFGERLPLPARQPFQLIYASRPSRGLGLALDVFEKLRARFPQLTLMVGTYSLCADPREDPELQPHRERLQQPGVRLEFFTKRALREALRHSAVMLYPNASDQETSCLAVIEAMAAGTPVVTSNRGCLSETVQHGAQGDVLPWTDDRDAMIAALSHAVENVLTQPVQWENYSQAGFATAHARHDARVVAGDWWEHVKEW